MRQRSISVFLLFVLANCFSNVVVCQVNGSGLLPPCVQGHGPVYFRVYNSLNPNGTVYDENSENITLKEDAPISVLIHGFTADPYSDRFQILVQCLIHKYGLNLILVDWRIGACTCGGTSLTRLPSYGAAANNTLAVGELLAKFLANIKTRYGVVLAKTILIGHSLGAQIASFCAKNLEKLGLGKPSHLWALEPAGPLFENQPCEGRVCITDADCVMGLHTSFIFGTHIPIGNIDCYLNGGAHQPNCNLTSGVLCSHVYGFDYFTRAMCGPNCTYTGKQWNIINPFSPISACSEDTCVTLSLKMDCQSLPNGTFYIDTTKMDPECVSLYSGIPSFFDSTNCTTPKVT